ncbi:hypothetical protein Tco_0843209 [Tanacetum coccineum]|uniref:Uncharacterized protein n=1 Tax=Tanacetum coccineum TaxID=301880 RepID=A0ABQ5B3N7_9ASTR
MSSDNASSAVTYTSISSDSDGPSWGIPLMNADELPEIDPYEEPVYLEYHVPSDDDIQIEDQPYAADASPLALSPGYIAESDPEEDLEEDSEEDPIDYVTVDPIPSAEETEPFETDESTATPPPPPPAYRTTSRIADIPKAELSRQKRLLLTAPIPRFEIRKSSTAAAARQPRSTVARRVDYGFVDTLDTSIHALEQKAMDADDRVALRDEVNTLRRYLSSLCTTHKQERVGARHALDRSEAHIKALNARIAVLETRPYRHEWQRQNADDCTTRHIMRIQALEAGACVDTLKDTDSSA